MADVEIVIRERLAELESEKHSFMLDRESLSPSDALDLLPTLGGPMADVEVVIRERLAELESEKHRLEAALAELISRSCASRRRKLASTSPRGARSAPRAEPRGRPPWVLAQLQRNSGDRYRARAIERPGRIKSRS
jgi:hypothetical protein